MDSFEQWRLGAAALLCAAALTACGGSEESSTTTAAGTTPATETTATTTGEPAATSTAATTTATEDLPGNGFASQSANNILAAARTSAQQALSVHVVGAVQDTSFDITFVRDEGSVGSVTVGGTTVEIVASGDRFYMRGDAEFYRQSGGEALAELVGDRWLSGPVDDPQFSGIAPLANVDRLLEESLDPSGTVRKGEETTVEGQPAIALVTDEGTLDVATTGTPFPLRITAQEDKGEMSFEGWDEEVEIPVPDDAIDVTELGRETK
jgi:hypothetical protein